MKQEQTTRQKIEYYDPIHNIVTIEDEPFLGLLSGLADEWDRLERIRSLGLISKVFLSATHSKKEHHIGSYHLARQVVGLSNSDHRRLCIVCLIRGIGHLPFTYSTEEALLTVYRISRNSRLELSNMLQPVIAMCRQRNKNCARDCLQIIITQHNYKELHKWFAAYKLVGQHIGKYIDSDVATLIYDLVCPQSRINKMADIIGRIDYIQRDIRYSAVGQLVLPSYSALKGIVNQVSDETETSSSAPEMIFIRDVRNYLDDILYADKKVALLDVLYRKQMTKIIIDKRVKVLDLLSWDDNQLETCVSDIARKSRTVESLSQLRNIAWPVVFALTINPVDWWGNPIEVEPLKIEKDIAGTTFRELLTYHKQKGFIIHVNRRPDKATRVSIYPQPEENRLMSLLLAVHNLLEYAEIKQGEFEVINNGIEDILKYILKLEDIKFNISAVKQSILSWSRNLNKRDITKLIKDSIDAGMPEFHSFFQFIRRQYFGRGATREFPEWLCKYLVIDSDLLPVLRAVSCTILKQLDSSSEKACTVFGIGADECLEVVAYLKEVWKSRQSLRSWIMPNPMFRFPNSTKFLECDVVSLILSKTGVRLRLLECTTQKSPKKARDDYNKLESEIGIAIRDRFVDLKFEPEQYSAAPINAIFKPASDLYRI